jgi:hypothetical protein
VLDWAFPVHVVDPARIAAARGRAFQQLRTELNRLRTDLVEAVDLDPVRDRPALEAILAHWSAGESHLAEPYGRLLDLFPLLPLRGRLIIYRGVPAAFAIWDEALAARGIANVFAHVGLREIGGLARFAILDMCVTLLARGFAEACIGGSESPGLDQFKRQLRPLRSLSLDSWSVDRT